MSEGGERPRCTIAVDLDGTLVPNLVDFEALREKVRRLLGVEGPLKPLGASLERLEIDEGLKRMAWDLIEEAEAESAARLDPSEALQNVEALRRAKAAGATLALVTARSDASARPILERLGILELFDAVVTRSLAGADRSAQLRALVAAGRLVLIGDTDYDEAAASSVGAAFIRVRTHREFPAAMEEALRLCLDPSGSPR
ncbi:MAG: haloacid dehalogenase-like hydrolase [Desulfurococcaceae archaeon]